MSDKVYGYPKDNGKPPASRFPRKRRRKKHEKWVKNLLGSR